MRGEQIPDLTMARTFKLLVIALFSLASSTSPASADDVIRIGIISTTFGYAPVFVAKEKGFFKRERLDPEIVVISRNEQIVQALISDSLQFGNVPPNLLFVLREGWAQKNRGLVVRYLKALVSTYRWLHDNRDEAIKLLPGITKLDPKYISKSWETYTQTEIWPRNGEST
jgi:ABC-type nitrate/sulfonate/bicarbonate transport system substrate-binding protein